MSVDGAKREWIARVFSIDLPLQQTDEGPLLPIWLRAKEIVDDRITQLQGTLRDYDDPQIGRIVEFGLNGVTDRNSVGLMVALREADTPGADARARAKLAAAIQSYRSFLNENVIIKLIDANPFGVAVGVKSTLGGALAALERRIAA